MPLPRRRDSVPGGLRVRNPMPMEKRSPTSSGGSPKKRMFRTSLADHSVNVAHDNGSAGHVDDKSTSGSVAVIKSTGVAAPSPAAARSTKHFDRSVLLHLFHCCGGKQWKKRGNWASKKPLHMWFGVKTADDDPERVVEIDLNNNGLRGRLPKSLGHLSQLTVLNLYDNEIGGRIPASICRLKRLQMLRLGSNELEGPIPTDIGQLTELRWLRLSCNNLTGRIPTSIGRLKKLHKLYLYSNKLSGCIPEQIGSMTELRRLGLNCNNLHGPLPASLCRLEQLTRLWLEGNPHVEATISRDQHNTTPPGQSASSSSHHLSCYSKQDVRRLFQHLHNISVTATSRNGMSNGETLSQSAGPTIHHDE